MIGQSVFEGEIEKASSDILRWSLERRNRVLISAAAKLRCPECNRGQLAAAEENENGFDADGLLRPKCGNCGAKISLHVVLRSHARKLTRSLAMFAALDRAYEANILHIEPATPQLPTPILAARGR